MLQHHLCRTSCCYLGLAVPLMHLRLAGVAATYLDCCASPTWLPFPFPETHCQVKVSIQAACCTAVQTVKVSLTNAQKQQMRECFHMMDVNNSGGIDARELGSAFQVGCVFVCSAQPDDSAHQCCMQLIESCVSVQAAPQGQLALQLCSLSHSAQRRYEAYLTCLPHRRLQTCKV